MTGWLNEIGAQIIPATPFTPVAAPGWTSSAFAACTSLLADKPILTDSGGFRVFSPGDLRKSPKKAENLPKLQSTAIKLFLCRWRSPWKSSMHAEFRHRDDL